MGIVESIAGGGNFWAGWQLGATALPAEAFAPPRAA
jgi:hypothetical protein